MNCPRRRTLLRITLPVLAVALLMGTCVGIDRFVWPIDKGPEPHSHIPRAAFGLMPSDFPGPVRPCGDSGPFVSLGGWPGSNFRNCYKLVDTNADSYVEIFSHAGTRQAQYNFAHSVRDAMFVSVGRTDVPSTWSYRSSIADDWLVACSQLNCQVGARYGELVMIWTSAREGKLGSTELEALIQRYEFRLAPILAPDKVKP